MRTKILFYVFLFVVCAGFSQNIPADIQQRLDEIRVQTRVRLDSARVNGLGVLPGVDLLSTRLFPLPEQRKRADSLGLELHWGMVYDEPMRERLVQLLNNKIREDELEILIDRAMARIENMGMAIFEQDAMVAMGVVNTREFRQVQDSLNRNRDKTVRERPYQNFDVFQYLQYDTLTVFRQTVDSLKKQEREDFRTHYLNQRIEISMIALVCGRIGDERFVEPLINALNRPDIDNREFGAIRESLVRMKVEPYYSEFVEDLIFSLEEIKEMDFVTHLNFYVDLLHTQESFRELSKYLHSNAYTNFSSEGPGGNASLRALQLINQNIENEDLQILINDPSFDRRRDILKVYDWMQENYGKYEIRRIW